MTIFGEEYTLWSNYATFSSLLLPHHQCASRFQRPDTRKYFWIWNLITVVLKRTMRQMYSWNLKQLRNTIWRRCSAVTLIRVMETFHVAPVTISFVTVHKFKEGCDSLKNTWFLFSDISNYNSVCPYSQALKVGQLTYKCQPSRDRIILRIRT